MFKYVRFYVQVFCNHGIELGIENCGIHCYWYQILNFWYSDVPICSCWQLSATSCLLFWFSGLTKPKQFCFCHLTVNINKSPLGEWQTYTEIQWEDDLVHFHKIHNLATIWQQSCGNMSAKGQAHTLTLSVCVRQNENNRCTLTPVCVMMTLLHHSWSLLQTVLKEVDVASRSEEWSRCRRALNLHSL